MATCINKNLSEFKEVANVMGSSILANSLIVSWQNFNNSDLIPTVTEALEFDKKTKLRCITQKKVVIIVLMGTS